MNKRINDDDDDIVDTLLGIKIFTIKYNTKTCLLKELNFAY